MILGHVYFELIYQDNMEYSRLDFGFIDNRLKIPFFFVSTLEHYHMINYGPSKFGTFKDETIPFGSSLEYSMGYYVFSIEAFA